MKNKLEDMTLEELWQLFPIFLVEHRAEWADWYQEESQSLLSQLPDGLVKRIAHVGSTAIPGIWAKNIVDILGGRSCDLNTLAGMYRHQTVLRQGQHGLPHDGRDAIPATCHFRVGDQIEAPVDGLGRVRHARHTSTKAPTWLGVSV